MAETNKMLLPLKQAWNAALTASDCTGYKAQINVYGTTAPAHPYPSPPRAIRRRHVYCADIDVPVLQQREKTLAMGTKLAIHSNSRYFDFLNSFVVKHAPWLWSPEGPRNGLAVAVLWPCRTPEPRSMLDQKTVEEIKNSGI